MSNKSLLVVSSCLVIVVSALLYLRLTDESATSTQGTESTQTADAQPEKLTEEQAIELVKALPDVAQWIAAVEANDDADSQPIFDANLDADGNYSVHAFEAFSDHTATFNWFTVDPESKKITEMFSTSDNDRQVELSTGSVSLVPYAVETLSFLYPESLLDLTETEKNTALVLKHSIPYEHADPCNFDIGDDLTELIDFHVVIKTYDQGLIFAIDAEQDREALAEYIVGSELQVNPGFIDAVTVAGYPGYKITWGVEGCGMDMYYVQVDGQHTLVIKQTWSELESMSSEVPTWLQLPGIIRPADADVIFTAWLDSLTVHFSD